MYILNIGFIFRKANNDQILNDAKVRLTALCQTHFQSIAKELHGIDPYQFSRAYTAGLQEFIEAYTFYEYLSGQQISEWNDLQEKLIYDKLPDAKPEDEKVIEEDCQNIDGCSEAKEDISQDSLIIEKDEPYKCLVQPTEFMLGIGDLSGEVMRRCINSLGTGDFDTCFAACNFLQSLYTGFVYIFRIFISIICISIWFSVLWV